MFLFNILLQFSFFFSKYNAEFVKKLLQDENFTSTPPKKRNVKSKFLKYKKEVYDFLNAQNVFETENNNIRLREIFYKLSLQEKFFYFLDVKEIFVFQFLAMRHIVNSVSVKNFAAKKPIDKAIIVLNSVSSVLILVLNI